MSHISDLSADSQSEYRLVFMALGWGGMIADWLQGCKNEVIAKIKMQSAKS
jgi:hypothetical protein